MEDLTNDISLSEAKIIEILITMSFITQYKLSEIDTYNKHLHSYGGKLTRFVRLHQVLKSNYIHVHPKHNYVLLDNHALAIRRYSNLNRCLNYG